MTNNKQKCKHNVYIQNCDLCNTKKDTPILHRNVENFDDGLTQVAPKGEFKARTNKDKSDYEIAFDNGYNKAIEEFEKIIEKIAVKSRSLGMNLISPLELKEEIRRLKCNRE